MSEKDNIKELFSQKLANHASEVNPQLWSSIASQIGAASAAAASGGLSILTKLIIGGAITGAAVIGSVLYVNSDSNENTLVRTEEQQPNNQVAVQEPVKPEILNEKTNVSREEQNPVDNQLNTNTSSENNTEIVSPEPMSDNTTGVLQERKDSDVKNETNVGPGVIGPNETMTIKRKQEEREVLENTVQRTEKDYELKLVNIFTPNGDGFNDGFELKSDGLSDFNIVIMDRNNKKLFESRNVNFSWNGTLADNITPAEAGSYIYIITAKDRSGNPVTEYSYLKLVR